jgi:hypothetical protein
VLVRLGRAVVVIDDGCDVAVSGADLSHCGYFGKRHGVKRRMRCKSERSALGVNRRVRVRLHG